MPRTKSTPEKNRSSVCISSNDTSIIFVSSSDESDDGDDIEIIEKGGRNDFISPSVLSAIIYSSLVDYGKPPVILAASEDWILTTLLSLPSFQTRHTKINKSSQSLSHHHNHHLIGFMNIPIEFLPLLGERVALSAIPDQDLEVFLTNDGFFAVKGTNWVAINNYSCYFGQKALQLIKSESLIVVCTYHCVPSNGQTSNKYIPVILFYLRGKDCMNDSKNEISSHFVTYFDPVILGWILKQTMGCSLYSNDNFPQYCSWLQSNHSFDTVLTINAGPFLENMSEKSLSHTSSISEESLTQLAARLRDFGVETNIRPYQLRGILWMFQKLTASSPTKSFEEAAHAAIEDDIDSLPSAWIRIPLLKTDFNTFISTTESTRNNGSEPLNFITKISIPSSQTHIYEKSLWYNLITKEVRALHCCDNNILIDSSSKSTLAAATSSSNTVLIESTQKPNSSTTDMNLKENSPRSVILADEMGMGKSLQAISLVILLKQMYAHKGNTDTPLAFSEKDLSASTPIPTLQMVENSMSNPKDNSYSKKYSRSSPTDGRKCACFCGRSNFENPDLGWIECSMCSRNAHISCAGFTSVEAATEAESYECFACLCRLYKKNPIKATTTTLIIMPDTLIHQWRHEIMKHIPMKIGQEHPLKVFLYEGCEDNVLKRRNLTYSDIHPHRLAAQDIIFISINTLRKEFAMATHKPRELSRRTKVSQFEYHPPPIMCIFYQLLVFDETQKLEGTSVSHILELACQIPSVMRLSVSGTPIGNDRLSDLRSLCQFLHLDPYQSISSQHAWSTAFIDSSMLIKVDTRLQWLVDIFSDITIRRTKKMVHDELKQPIKTVISNFLVFSKFERALYTERQKLILSILSDVDQKWQDQQKKHLSGNHWQTSSSAVDTRIATARENLDLLRKGCCHPQVFDRSLNIGRRGSNAQSKTPRPFGEIIILKVEQSRLNCEEKMRQLLFHLFTMAGVDLLSASIRASGSSYMTREECTFYEVRALLIYVLAWNVVRNQYSSICPLVTLLKVSVSESEGDSQDLITSHEIALHWKVDFHRDVKYHSEPNILITSSSSPIIQQQVETVAQTPSSDDTQERDHKRPRIADSEDTLPIPWTDCKTRGVFAHYNEPRGGQVFALMKSRSAKFVLERSHQLLTIQLSINVKDIVASMSPSSFHAIVFPATCSLFATVGQLETLALCHNFDISIDQTISGATISNMHGQSSDIKISNPYRSKTFKLIVTAVHEDVLLLYKSDSNRWCYRWSTLPIAAKLSKDDFRKELSEDCPKTSLNFNATLQPLLTFKILFGESSFVVDSFQELHLSNNMTDSFEFMRQSPHMKNRIMHNIIRVGHSNSLLTSLNGKVKDILESSGFEESSINNPVFASARHSTSFRYVLEEGEDDQSISSSCSSSVSLASSGSSSDETREVSHFIDAVSKRQRDIEADFVKAAKAKQQAVRYNLDETCTRNNDIELEFKDFSETGDRDWWTALLNVLQHDESFLISVRSSIDEGGHAYTRFQNFRDVSGLAYLISCEHGNVIQSRNAALTAMLQLSAEPSLVEIANGSNCRKCRSYLQKTGPICAHCQLGEVVDIYAKSLITYRNNVVSLQSFTTSATRANALPAFGAGGFAAARGEGDEEFDTVQRGEFEVDAFYVMIMKLLRSFAHRSNISTFIRASLLEIKFCAGLKTELAAMKELWFRHLELLKTYDELDQCKQRLVLDTSPERNTATSSSSHAAPAQVDDGRSCRPSELAHSHLSALTQAICAEVDVNESCSNLNFYKNQEIDSRQAATMSSKIYTANDGIIELNDDSDVEMEDMPVPTPSIGSRAMHDDASSHACVICTEDLRDCDISQDAVVMLPCAHIYHKNCIMQWIVMNKTCVMCKRSARSKDLEVVHGYGQMAVSTKAKQLMHGGLNSIEMRVSRTSDLEANTNSHACDTTVSRSSGGPCTTVTNGGLVRRDIEGKFGTKIDALVGDLVAFVEGLEYLGEKAIVFTLWPDLLWILKQAFKVNKLNFVCCSDPGKDFNLMGPLDSFKSNPEVRILLMPISLGAEGLDLIVASHVFLLEPLLSTSMEAQAVNRVDRIGQNRPTFIHKYIIRDTVEDNIHKLREENIAEMDDEASLIPNRMYSSVRQTMDKVEFSFDNLLGLMQDKCNDENSFDENTNNKNNSNYNFG